MGDKGSRDERGRRVLRRRRLTHTIPARTDQRERRAHRPGRNPRFDRATYRRRHVVERGIHRLQPWRSEAPRCDKHAANDWAMGVIASILLWLES